MSGRETLRSCGEWAHTTFGRATIPRALARAEEELIEAKEAAPEDVLEEIADVVICLAAAALSVGDLQTAIDRKMAINRERKWDVRGDGTGYHRKSLDAQ